MSSNEIPEVSPYKRSSLSELVQSTIPLSLVPSPEQINGMAEKGSRVLSITPSGSQAPPKRMQSLPQGIAPNTVPSPRPDSLNVKKRTSDGCVHSDRSPSEIVKELRKVSNDSVFDSDSDSVSNLTKLNTETVLQPRQDTVNDWAGSRSPNRSDSDILSFREALNELDKQAESQKRLTIQSENRALLSQPVSWEETAEMALHMWVERDTREACHINETQYCQDQKLLHSKRHKVRCSACKVLVHTTCIRQLYYHGNICKPTFREIKQKVKDTTLNHHFMQRRKMSGKCPTCRKGFGNWKNFSGRTFEGISCSWCGDAYHIGCFSDKLRDEPCHLGPLRNMIIPPSWIIKLPKIETEQDGEGSSSRGSSRGSFERRRKKTSRRRSKRNSSLTDDRASKYFTVKPLASSHNKPVIVFINPKSGGNEGAKIMRVFQWFLNPRQVFDLTQGGPKFGLQLYRNCPNLRILACGGDGTAGWILSVLDQMEFKPFPPVAVLPLGTGNDLSRVLGWGAAYADEPLDNILMHVEDGPVIELDRWMLSVWPNPEIDNWSEMEGKDDVPLHVINNYFSIGADAQVAVEFHESREANPQKFNSRFRNKFQYSKLAGQDLVLRKFANLTDNIKLVCDGNDLTSTVRQLRLEAICFLNITSYGSGCNPWGSPVVAPGQKFGPQALDDEMIEVIGFWSTTFPKLLVGAHGERIAQCQHIKLHTFTSLPVQIDGEACKIKPSIIEVVHQNKALMVRKTPLRTSPAPLRDVAPSYQLKVSVSKVNLMQYEKLHSDLYEIRKEAVGLGLVLTTPADTLKALRPQINRFTKPKEFGKSPQLSKNWQYLDVASSGRLDRVFQILPEQEESITVGDMLSDGILLVEFEESLTSPMESTLDIPQSRSVGMGRSPSYNLAISSDSEFVPEHSQQTTMSPIDEETTGKSGEYILESPVKSPEPIIVDDGYDGDTDVLSTSGLSPLPIIDIDSQSDSDSGTKSDRLQKVLFDSVKRGNLVKIKEIHNQGARLANVDVNGLTPLHHAARLGRKEVVKYIVDNVPREALDLQDEDKAQTALHKAAWYGYRGICKILVEANASLLRTDYQGNTPYLKSIESEDVQLQEYLLRKEREQKIKFDLKEAAV